MPRGATQKAVQLAADTNANGQAFQNQGNALNNTASTFFKNELNNPQGFSPDELSAMLTASSQSVGGSQAGTVGQGNLLAARTGNNAGLATTLDQSQRNASKQLSNNALGVQEQNAELKQKQQQAGAQGVQQMGSEDIANSLRSLGLSNDAINTWIKGSQATQAAIGQNIKTGEDLAKMAAGGVAGGGFGQLSDIAGGISKG